MRKALWIATVALTLTGTVAAPGAAFGQVAGSGSASVAAVDPVIDTIALDRAFVKSTIALRDPRSLVRAAATNAWLSTRGDVAIVDYLATGHAGAVKRANVASARNTDFTKQILATHKAKFAPQVNAAAQRAVNGTAADRDLFAGSGYAAAKALDRQNREAKGDHAAALVPADRDFVTVTADSDPGAQVRAAAAGALRPGAGDGELVEFFTHDWPQASAVDLDQYRGITYDQEVPRLAANRQLVLVAQAKDQAAADAPAETAEAARAEAALAWRAVAEQAGAARTAWAEALVETDRQAENWQAVVATAGGTVVWPAILDTARLRVADWTSESVLTSVQSDRWAAQVAQAEARELALAPIEPTPTS